MRPTVSVIIPTNNRQTQLVRLLDSIKVSTYKPLEIIVVNDSSSKLNLNFSNQNITMINNRKNQGLAFSRKAGAQKSKGELTLFIDDDNIIDKNMIKELVSSFNKADNVAAVGPITYYFSNKNKVWFMGSEINLTTTIPKFYKEVNKLRLNYGNLFIVENLHNCFMMRRKLGSKVGWFDEKIFMNGTEFDLIKRIKRKYPQVLIAINTEAKCYHDVPEYSKDLVRSLGFENKKRVYYFQRNRGVFVGRYGSMLQKFLLSLIFYPLFFTFYSLLFIFNKKFTFLIWHVKGTISGYYYLLRGL